MKDRSQHLQPLHVHEEVAKLCRIPILSLCTEQKNVIHPSCRAELSEYYHEREFKS